MQTKEMPINCAARNSVWVYPRAVPPRLDGALVIFEIAHSHEHPDIFSLPEGSDVMVELYGGAVVLRLEGELRRVHIRRFDHVAFLTEEARHAFMRLWKKVEMLESPLLSSCLPSDGLNAVAKRLLFQLQFISTL